MLLESFLIDPVLNPNLQTAPLIAVVIPCYKVRDRLPSVIRGIGKEVSRIYLVDDGCPQHSAQGAQSECNDERVKVLPHTQNRGVGAAVMTGYRAALSENMEIIVKIDGDGQMDPCLIPAFVAPIITGRADYTKGNRFFDLEHIGSMPKARLFGNTALSLITKISSGYWNLFDPTNGYTAIHHEIAKRLPLDKISARYFFESDVLFRLNVMRAVVLDIPMDAKYAGEVSSLKIGKVVGEFFIKNIRNFLKRIFYSYYLRDTSIASIELPTGSAMLLFGLIFGWHSWMRSIKTGEFASSGTVMLSALPTILGLQLILAFLGHDIRSVPDRPLHPLFAPLKKSDHES